MSVGLLGCDEPLVNAHDVALVDLDGVVYRGPHAIDYAASSFMRARAVGMRLVFVTNNASREPGQVAEHLSDLGIPTTAEEVMTSAQAAATLLGTRLAAGAPVLVIGGQGLRTAVRDAGFIAVSSADDAPQAVVQGYSPDLGWADLAEAAYAVEQGAWHVATNLDLSIPTARGVAPGNGTLVRAVQSATGVVPDAAGKPSPTMYHLAVQRAGARSVLVIGDRLDTDLAGARSGGYHGLVVLTGVNSARDVILAPATCRPHFIGADLRCLFESQPAPRRADGEWWHCGPAAARVHAGALDLTGDDSIDLVRAAAAAAWESTDQGAPVDEATVPNLLRR